MDGHEIYAGKGVAALKIPFLQHEYTWSDHCITGNKLGWGITASSIPESREILHEVEKLAADTEPDRLDGIPVEDLIYSPVIGFTRTCTLPLDQGKDRRNNKLVKILQTTDPEGKDPAVYFAGTGSAFDLKPEGKGRKQLPVKKLSPMQEDPDDILLSMGLMDKLSIFLRALFWSLLEYPGSLNIVSSSWDKTRFAWNSGRLMYAVHCLLPESLRTKAGYRSYAWKECNKTAFYFSRKVYGQACFELDRSYQAEPGNESDVLGDYFFDSLALCWRQERELYHEAMKEISACLDDWSGSGMGLKKIQWVYYHFMTGRGKEALPDDYILQSLPELIYWGNREERFREIAEVLLHDIHEKDLTPAQEEAYTRALLEKVSTRSLPDICRELEYILDKKDRDASGEAEALLIKIKESNELIYRGISEDLSGQEGWKDLFGRLEPAGSDPVDAGDEETAAAQPPAFLQEAMKNRRSDGMLLEGGQAEDDQTGLYSKTAGADAESPPALPGDEDRSGIVKDAGGREKESRNREAAYRVLKDEEEADDSKGNTREFLITSLPTGFLTGCVLFLSHYSLMIGHWKIAVGMGGMWLVLILNYAYLLKKTQPHRHLWMGIGLCFVIGEIISLGADYFVRQEFRIYYFIALGAIAAATQIIRLLKETIRKHGPDKEMQGDDGRDKEKEL